MVMHDGYQSPLFCLAIMHLGPFGLGQLGVKPGGVSDCLTWDERTWYGLGVGDSSKR